MITPRVRRPARAEAGRHRLSATSRGASACGFTLVEALATLVFIGIVIPVVLSATSVATRTASVAGHRIEATMLAEAKLEQVVATRMWEDGDAAGDFAMTASGEPLGDRPERGPGAYRWELIVEESLDIRLRQLRVRVTWLQRGHEHAVELATLVREDG